MALFSPVIRSDFNLYERKRPQPRNRSLSRPNPVQISSKIATGKESTSLDSLLDKHQKLMMIREKRQQKRNNRRSNTLNFRKISVITETDEDIEDSLENLEQKMTSTNPLGSITPIAECSEEENNPPQKSIATQSEPVLMGSENKKKKSVMAMFNDWVKNRSLKRRKSKNDDKMNPK